MSSRAADAREVEAGLADAGRRVDAFLAAQLPDLSRSRLKSLLREGCVRLSGAVVAEASLRVKAGQLFQIEIPPVRAAEPQAQDLPLDVLYEDEHLLVLVKPAGLVVHPAPGHADMTLVNALLAHCAGRLSGIGGVARPGIVHRLDREVSGVLVVAKTDAAHRGLAGQFTLHTVERIYEAVVWGLPDPTAGSIEGAIGRHPKDRLRMTVVEEGGKPALTRYRVLETAGTAASRLACTLETGRTHQIRVHLSHIGHGLIGDPLYGAKRRRLPGELAARIDGLGRIALHARTLGFTHPGTGEVVRFEAPAPALFAELMTALSPERLRLSGR